MKEPAVDVLAVMDVVRRALVIASKMSPIPTSLELHDEAREAMARLIAAAKFAVAMGRVTDGLRDALDGIGGAPLTVDRRPSASEVFDARVAELVAEGIDPVTASNAALDENPVLQSHLAMKGAGL